MGDSGTRPHANGAERPSTNDPNTFPCLQHGVPPVEISIPRGLHSTSWDYVDATQHVVRGANYLADKKKYPSKPAAFKLVEVAGFSTDGPCRFYSELQDSYYSRAREAGRDVFLFIMHFDLRPMHTVMVFELDKVALQEDKPFANAFQRFLQGDDAYKNKRIKLLTSVVDANWMVKKAIGQPVPALIGNKLSCYYRQADDLCECTCDVNSSMAAAAIVGVCTRVCVSSGAGSCGILCILPLARRDSALCAPRASFLSAAIRGSSGPDAWLAMGRLCAWHGDSRPDRVCAQVVKGACKNIVCDLFLMIEGQAEDELPERVRPRPRPLSPAVLPMGQCPS